ncbi:porin [Mesorhizobium sp. CO1-1-8]|uniref:porin n=1 Tax=Mesorhizobium sp. CO1-1-8 TaxID=2876631 RepID=UPI001CD0CEA0|nr:porin [Mesorhizobium sp. CO1-1-8]MBZ9772178.1 porin [Mesorhizobium sp. CO1-1-8]
MNIKSLLVGSAAALVAVSGARAADAGVVAEPEPAEYVKICDVYGAGYFYIPGTETCLRIGGYVRYDIGVGDREGVLNAPDHLNPGDRNDTFWKRARFNLKTWTGQETELGTLKTYTETRFNFGNAKGDYAVAANPDGWQAVNSAVTLNFAWIQLGGLRVGRDDSTFSSFLGYAANVIDDTIVPYGALDTNLISYYFDAGNGLSAVVSFEEGAGANTIDSYVPHVAGGLKYAQSWGSISGVVGYDSNYEAFTGKARIDVKASDALSLFLMAGYGNKADFSDPNKGVNFYKNWQGSWAVWGGGTYTLSPKTSLNAQLSYDAGKTFAVAANVSYEIVKGFKVIAEADYFNKASSNWHAAATDGIGGVLRFQRSF